MKNQFQDIVPPDKRSIRNIPLPDRKQESSTGASKSRSVHIKRSVKSPSEEEILQSERKEAIKLESKQDKIFEYLDTDVQARSPRISLWIITVVVVALLFWSITGIFKSAVVSVTEKAVAVSISGVNTFVLNPSSDQAGYSAITITDTASTLVPSTGERQVSSKSTGTVVIYNSANSSSQKLVAGTRLETPAGLIFKLDNTVTVPAVTKGKTKDIPGSVEVAVTAEKPGSDYNIALSDFTIPGFKGSAKYSTFYGRSKAAMTGGNVGTVATIDDATLKATVANLEKKLETTLKEKAAGQLPSTQKTFDGFEKITYTVSDPKLQGEGQSSKALVKVDATAKVYALDVASFARKLLAKASSTASNSDNLSIDFSGIKATFGSEASSTLIVSLDGSARVIWNLDAETFQKALAGKPLSEAPSIAAGFPSIDKVSFVIKPISFWHPSLPKDPSKISVKLVNGL